MSIPQIRLTDDYNCRGEGETRQIHLSRWARWKAQHALLRA